MTTPRTGHRAAAPSGGRRDAGALTAGTILSGLAAYAFIAVGTRTVGADGFAPVSILWTLWAATAAFITFPVQHWAVRTIEADGHEGSVRSALPLLGGVAVGLGLLMAAGAAPVRLQLFGTSDWAFPIMTGLLPLGSVAMGLNRGVLSGRRRFTATGLAIVGENVIRLLAAVVVAVVGGGAVALGASILCGFAVAALWPDSFVLRATGANPVSSGDSPSPLRFLSGVAGGSLAAQLVLTSGPVVLAALGGSAEQVTSLFAALALARAPYMVMTGVAPRLTTSITLWVVHGHGDRVRRLRTAVVAGTLLAGLLAAALAWSVGGSVIRIAFGPGTSLRPALLALVAVGTVLAIAALVLTLVLIAQGTTGAVTRAWLVGTGAAGAVVVSGVLDPTARVVAATVLAQATATVLLWFATAPAGHAADRRRPHGGG